MAKKGRPRLGGEARTERILVCLEPTLRSGIEDLAQESRRSLSDYCRYVLEQHVLIVKEDEPVKEVPVEVTPALPVAPIESLPLKADTLPTCGTCNESFASCDC